ncbi:MAG: hypothetical protein ACYDBW_00155 [Sulfuricaulis sp.]
MVKISNKRAAKESAGMPVGVTRTVRKLPRLSIYMLSSIALAVVVFAIARNQGLVKGSEVDLTQWSALYASVCAIPIIWMILREPRSGVERVLIALWWPLKLGFMFYYVFSVWGISHHPDLYLHYSDNLSWHVAASRVADYWSVHGVGLIPKDTLILMSMNYPAAGYFFGSIYYCFGPSLGATLPWLSLVALLSAAIAQRLLEQCELPRAEAKVAFHFLLWSPVLWLYASLVQRDLLIIYVWLVIAYSTVLLFQRVNLLSLGVLGVSTIILANLRAEYLYVELAWLVAVASFSLGRRQGKGLGTRVALLGIATGCAVLIAWGIWGHGGSSWYMTKYDLARGVEGQLDVFLKEGRAGSGFYGAILSLGGVFLIPFILPFKLLVGLTAPFPWNFSTFVLAVTQPFYSLESIIRLSLMFFSLRVVLRWKMYARNWSAETKLVLVLGVLVGVAGLLGPVSEVRYLAPAIPFLVPVFSPFAYKARSWMGGTLFAVLTIVSLQFLYFVLRPVL